MEENIGEQMQIRRDKYKKFLDLGINVYGEKYERTNSISELHKAFSSIAEEKSQEVVKLQEELCP